MCLVVPQEQVGGATNGADTHPQSHICYCSAMIKNLAFP